jgi:hypothetical protein
MPNKLKVCAACGKAEGANWAYHWRTKHPGIEIEQLLPGQVPTNPYDINWVYLIKDKITRDLFMDHQ